MPVKLDFFFPLSPVLPVMSCRCCSANRAEDRDTSIFFFLFLFEKPVTPSTQSSLNHMVTLHYNSSETAHELEWTA